MVQGYAEDFNDDSLGRSLETLYAKGVTEVFAKVAARALKVYQIEHRFVHLDSSSFHLHEQYELEEPDKEAITITEGFSRDHRPDLKQVVVQLITSQRSALPIWAEKQWHKLCLQTFNCQADAQAAANQFNQRWKFHQAKAEVVPITQYARRGRPAAEDQRCYLLDSWGRNVGT